MNFCSGIRDMEDDKIATEYGVSESYVGRLRGEMKKEKPDG